MTLIGPGGDAVQRHRLARPSAPACSPGRAATLCSILDPIADSLERLGGVLSWRDERLSTYVAVVLVRARARRIRAASHVLVVPHDTRWTRLAVASVAALAWLVGVLPCTRRAGRVRRLREDRGDLRALSAEPARGAARGAHQPRAPAASASARWRRSSPRAALVGGRRGDVPRWSGEPRQAGRARCRRERDAQGRAEEGRALETPCGGCRTPRDRAPHEGGARKRLVAVVSWGQTRTGID